jgi:hypothetical protein
MLRGIEKLRFRFNLFERRRARPSGQLTCSVTRPSWAMRLADRSSGPTSPRFSFV